MGKEMNYKKIYGKELNIAVANDLTELYNLKAKSDESPLKSAIKLHNVQFTSLVPSIADQCSGSHGGEGVVSFIEE